jgi:hypothetical protein
MSVTLDEFFRVRDLSLPLPGTSVERDIPSTVLDRAVCYCLNCKATADTVRPFWSSTGRSSFKGFFCQKHALDRSLCWECGVEAYGFNVATIYKAQEHTWRPFVIRYCDYLVDGTFGSFFLDETCQSIEEVRRRAHHHARLVIDTTADDHEEARALAKSRYWTSPPERVEMETVRQMTLFQEQP